VLLHAPAKINLHLQIAGRRSDGYHEILSLVQAVSLFDSLHVRSLKQRNLSRCVCAPVLPGLPQGQRNIAMRAADAFLSRCAIDAGVEVRIRKRIPAGAGLGGGSSDAAAVLLALNRLYSSPLSPERLQELAAELGSDVPFFLGPSAALMLGRGEILRPVPPRGDFRIVLVYPGFPVSTADAYRWYDQQCAAGTGTLSSQQIVDRYRTAPPGSWSFTNDFQAVLLRRYPSIARIAAELQIQGAELAGVSGSGSAVFALFSNQRAAGRAYRRVRRRFRDCWLLVPLQSGGPAD
jgi:4-diphosphocytidyl-2-C-methyl-D-erythritol kinase